MLARATILAAMTLAIGLAPAQALAAHRDVAATHAYIQANYALARISVAQMRPTQAKIERFNSKLALECPGIGAGTLQNEASQPVSYEVAAALWSLDYGTIAGPIRTFLNTVGRLRWSNAKITRLAKAYARTLNELATLPLPDLCQEVRAWKASGFQIVPAATVSTVRHVEAIEPRQVPARLLAPYERGADAGIWARTRGLEAKLSEQEFQVGQTDWIQVLQTLGLPQ